MNRPPELSIVICTYNRDPFIRRSLECLFRQTLPADRYEVIVVDNHSTDDTAAIVQQFKADHPQAPLRYVFEAQKGLSFARNRGLAEAQAPVITYVDDDAEAVEGFAEAVLRFMQSHPHVDGLGGKVVPVYPGSGEPAWMNKYLNGFVGSVDHGATPLPFNEKMKYPAGCNMTYRKSILQRAGGFNNQLTFRSDDKYIFFKVKEAGATVYYLPEALVYHNIDAHRLSFANFRKLFLKTGNEEKVRLRSEGGFFGLLKKLAELKVKLLASLALYLVFLFKGQEIKGRYVVYAQWFTLLGFLRKSVFVR